MNLLQALTHNYKRYLVPFQILKGTRYLLAFAFILFLSPSSTLHAAQTHDRLTQMRQEEMDAKQAKADELASRAIALQKQVEEERRNVAKSQEKIWQEYTQSSEIERKKLKDQMTVLDERQKMFEEELTRKREQDNVLLGEKESEARRLTLEMDRLRVELEQDRKAYEAHLEELKNRPEPPPASPQNLSQPGTPSEVLPDGAVRVAETGGANLPRPRNARGEYYVEMGDILDVDVWRVPDLSRSVPVRPDGRISMPVVGDLAVEGMTLVQVRDLLTEKFSEYVWNPQVSISIRQFGGRKFIILGEIAGPGVYRFEHEISLLEAIALSGGFKERSRRGKIMIIRGDIHKQPQVKIISANMENVLRRGMISENINILPNDIIYVGKDIIGDYREVLDNVVAPFFDTAIDYFVLHSASRADHNS